MCSFTLDYVSILFVVLKCMHRTELPSQALGLPCLLSLVSALFLCEGYVLFKYLPGFGFTFRDQVFQGFFLSTA